MDFDRHEDHPAGEPSIVVSDALNENVRLALESGKTVWLRMRQPPATKDDRVAFSTIFWNTAYTGRQPPLTLGLLIDAKHPLFAAFPTQTHSNYQWWEIVKNARIMDLKKLPPDLRPIVQVIPDWFNPRRMGLCLEARVGKGKLLATSIDFDAPKPNLALRQLQHSILEYLKSDAFAPKKEVSYAMLENLERPWNPSVQ